jgi:hypothetical protein
VSQQVKKQKLNQARCGAIFNLGVFTLVSPKCWGAVQLPCEKVRTTD